MSAVIGCIVLHLLICAIVSACVAEKTNKKFWWMFFFGVPIGLIIAILLDISDAKCGNQEVQTETKPEVPKPLPTITVEKVQNKPKEVVMAIGFLLLIGVVVGGIPAILSLF